MRDEQTDCLHICNHLCVGEEHCMVSNSQHSDPQRMLETARMDMGCFFTILRAEPTTKEVMSPLRSEQELWTEGGSLLPMKKEKHPEGFYFLLFFIPHKNVRFITDPSQREEG